MRWILTLCLLLTAQPAAAHEDWRTPYETSRGHETPRYDEVLDYCRDLASASRTITLDRIGRSPQGRELILMVADRDGLSTPEEVRGSGRTVLLLQACIHAGESDGKDAGLMLLRDLAVGGLGDDLLEHVTILFLPIFNVDGHEHFGPLNRPNQNGPLAMGFRSTATNLNLNRDFVKADAPEMRDWLRFYAAWLPDFTIDSHVSDGADFQTVLMYDLPCRGPLELGLAAWCRDAYLPGLEADLADEDLFLQPYAGFRRHHDPRSGLVLWNAAPRYTHGYAAARNRPGLLLETHVLKDYPTRVRATYAVMLGTLRLLDRDHAELRRLNAAADRLTASAAFRDRPFPLSYRRLESDSVMIDFRGYDYEMIESEVTGGRYPVFHRDRPRTFRVPMFGTFAPDAVTAVPEAFLIPPEWHEVIALLVDHGVAISRLSADKEIEVQSVRFEEPDWESAPYEGRHRLDFVAVPDPGPRTFPAGTAIVPLDQPAARLVLHMLMPASPDALVRWGFFDPVFERKEYVESYVLEPLLPGLLAADPELAAAWARAVADDPQLMRNHWRALLWFYRRTPWWDDRIARYPVAWTSDAALAAELSGD